MMWILWSKISYMAQILVACLVFMIPAEKRSHFKFRVAINALVFLLGAYGFTLFYDRWSSGRLDLGYWGAYIVGAVLFVWFGMECTFLEAVYAAVCSCGMQHIAFDFYMIIQLFQGNSDPTPKLGGSILFTVVYLLVYLLGYFLFARKMTEYGKYRVQKDAVVPMVTMIMLVWIISIIELSALNGFESGMYSHVVYRLIDALCCCYVLWVQINQKEKMSLQRELDGINAAVRQQSRQYEMTSETIDSINRKCHDLKHQIRMLKGMTNEQQKAEYLEEIENDIMIYDTALMTGNKALDTVLMEKGLFCKDHKIQWSCMVDGTKLDFMKLEDIYAIFGNALDNAITAVLNLADEEQRVISVKILEQNNLLMIQIQNYYDKTLHFEDGLPVTTRKNRKNHGFGMKSIRYTAEKYDGIVTVQAKKPIFMLQVLIPVKAS